MPIRNPDPAGAPTGLYVARRDGPEDFLPTTGAPITMTGGVISWEFGSWTTVGTPGSDFLLSTIHAIARGLWGNLEQFILELAYGDAKTPVDVARFNLGVFLPGEFTDYVLPGSILCRPVTVPAGETLFARLASSSMESRTAEMFVSGWPSSLPTWDELPQNTVAGPGRLYPSNASDEGVGLLTGTGWAYGAGVTVVDPAPNDMLVTRLISVVDMLHYLNAASVAQVGYGASGAETWCATVLYGRLSTPPWVYPPVWVKEGERLALRGASTFARGMGFFVKVYDL